MLLDFVYQTGEIHNVSGGGFQWTSLIAPGLTLATILIGLWQYRNYDLKKIFKKKQLETAMDLIIAIEKTKLKIEYNSTQYDNPYNYTMTLQFNELHKAINDVYFQTYSRYPNFFLGYKVLYELEFLSFAENPYLAKPIAIELKKIVQFEYPSSPSTPTTADLDEEDDYVLIKSVDIEMNGKHISMRGKRFTNPELQTLHSYLYHILRIKRSINDWLKQFDIKDLNSLDELNAK